MIGCFLSPLFALVPLDITALEEMDDGILETQEIIFMNEDTEEDHLLDEDEEEN